MYVKCKWDTPTKQLGRSPANFLSSYQYREMGQPASAISIGHQAEPPNISANEFEAFLTDQLKRIVLSERRLNRLKASPRLNL